MSSDAASSSIAMRPHTNTLQLRPKKTKSCKLLSCVPKCCKCKKPPTSSTTNNPTTNTSNNKAPPHRARVLHRLRALLTSKCHTRPSPYAHNAGTVSLPTLAPSPSTTSPSPATAKATDLSTPFRSFSGVHARTDSGGSDANPSPRGPSSARTSRAWSESEVHAAFEGFSGVHARTDSGLSGGAGSASARVSRAWSESDIHAPFADFGGVHARTDGSGGSSVRGAGGGSAAGRGAGEGSQHDGSSSSSTDSVLALYAALTNSSGAEEDSVYDLYGEL